MSAGGTALFNPVAMFVTFREARGAPWCRLGTVGDRGWGFPCGHTPSRLAAAPVAHRRWRRA